jgi:integral membrane protein (TIGR00529 family)
VLIVSQMRSVSCQLSDTFFRINYLSYSCQSVFFLTIPTAPDYTDADSKSINANYFDWLPFKFLYQQKHYGIFTFLLIDTRGGVSYFSYLSFVQRSQAIPTLFKVFIVFALILFLHRLRLHLSLSLFLGSLALAFWMGLGVYQSSGVIFASAANLQTIGILLIVWLIMVMSKIMKEAGQMERLVASFSRLSGDPRTVGSVMTALIGLLPMPGGALFSAPMVEASLEALPVNREQKTIINYWFRHLWEYWWPIYPGVILALALLKLQTWTYIATMAPVTAISIVAGLLFILRPIPLTQQERKEKISWGALRDFLREILPILIIIFFILFQAALTSGLSLLGVHLAMPAALSILPGLVAALAWVAISNHLPVDRIRVSLMDRGSVPLLLLIVAIMIFQGVLRESQAALQIRSELLDYRIPVSLVIMILPFISGLITGIAVGFVGTSFPLIIPMFPEHHLIGYLSSAALAFTFGYMGMMLSPVHLCFLVTKDYYRASLIKSYRYLVAPALSVMGTVTVIFFLLRSL